MGTHRVVLPEAKFSGQDAREFLRDLTVNEWTDEKAGQYLAVYLKDDAKAFYHQQSESVKKIFLRIVQGFEAEIRGSTGLVEIQEIF